ncbi:uncharacterized protein BO97DRAFT_478115 [Aspergillus homomorphus CBS 101889]|uniref:Uncharacterized protein n=1 Tax=Aspergillus homomorphus (strain CBS 101889) TaxID=1450537 RepID=A0A395HWT8_ASPHC|nr:hypothetical protein BO97DRAFT_478115 [Aspergillus homomorphus CBS 101889]RAL11996.1 hypothetical protein BO97DRAFT_478115 [Aspergillus homomorphus CBS 101889]
MSNRNRLSLQELREDKKLLDAVCDEDQSAELTPEWFEQNLHRQVTEAEQRTIDLDRENTVLKHQLSALRNALEETEKDILEHQRELKNTRKDLKASKEKNKKKKKDLRRDLENANKKSAIWRERSTLAENLLNEAKTTLRDFEKKLQHRNTSFSTLQDTTRKACKKAQEEKRELGRQLRNESYNAGKLCKVTNTLERENELLKEKLRRVVRTANEQDKLMGISMKGKSGSNNNGKKRNDRNNQRDLEMVDILDEKSQSKALAGFGKRLSSFSKYASSFAGFESQDANLHNELDMQDFHSDSDINTNTGFGGKWWVDKPPPKKEMPKGYVAQLWNSFRENILVDEGVSSWPAPKPRVPLPDPSTEPRLPAIINARKRGYGSLGLDDAAMAPDAVGEVGEGIKRMRMDELPSGWPSKEPDSGFMAITKMLDDLNVSRAYLDEMTPEMALEKCLTIIRDALQTKMERTPTIDELLQSVVWYLQQSTVVNRGPLDIQPQVKPVQPPLVPEARVISIKSPTEQASTTPTKFLPREKTKFVGPSYLPPTHKPTHLRHSFPPTAKQWTKLSQDKEFADAVEVKTQEGPEYVLMPTETRDFRKFSGAVDDPKKPLLGTVTWSCISAGVCVLAYICVNNILSSSGDTSSWLHSNEIPLQFMRLVRSSQISHDQLLQQVQYGAAKMADINASMLG